MDYNDAIKLIETDETKSVKRAGWQNARIWHVFKNQFFPERRSLLWQREDGCIFNWLDNAAPEDISAEDWELGV